MSATESAIPPVIAELIAEHDQCRSRLDAALAVLAAGPEAADIALSEARSLLLFLERELEAHIAKEEGPLFPRLKAALPAGDRLIDEMIAEHDLIRIKRSDVRDLLTALLGSHDDLRLDRAALRAILAQAHSAPASMAHVQQAIETVAAKLHVHFENEEELLFPLAPELLGVDELDAVAAEIAALGDPAAI